MPSFRFPDLSSVTVSDQSTAIKRPREFTHFSFDDQHVCHPLSDQSLRYYCPPSFPCHHVAVQPIDLSRGLQDFNRYEDTTDLHLDALLETIEQYERKEGAKVDAHIVTWRGMMTKIMTALFDEYAGFEMNATRYEDTIYIEENHAARKPVEKRPGQKPSFAERAQFWGYKFEAISTLPKPWAYCSRDEIETRQSTVVDTHAQYCSVVRTGIGGHTLILAGEVDAVLGKKPDDPNAQIPYVELKTSQDVTHASNNNRNQMNHQRAIRKLENKMCRFWAQSFLLGIPIIVIGFRDDRGHLLRLEEWKTLDIPNHVTHRGLKTWNGNVCINFTATFLDFLKLHITDGNWRIVLKQGTKHIDLYRVDEELAIVTPQFKMHRESLKRAAADDDA